MDRINVAVERQMLLVRVSNVTGSKLTEPQDRGHAIALLYRIPKVAGSNTN
jgi:hypothetical protein